MKKIRISDATAGELNGLIAQQQEAILTIGRARVFRLFFLPALKWQSKVQELENPRLAVNIRAIHDEATMAGIIMDELIGVLILGETDAAYLVPAVPYWRALVEPEEVR